MDIFQKGAFVGRGTAEVCNLIRLFGKDRTERILDDLARKKQARLSVSTPSSIADLRNFLDELESKSAARRSAKP